MTSVRLLPLVVFAALALLVLKGVGLVTEGGYVLTGVNMSMAQDPVATASSGENAGQTMETDPAAAAQAAGENPAAAESAARTGITDPAAAAAAAAADAAERASESLFSRAGPTPVSSNQLDAVPFELSKSGEKVPLTPADGANTTEKAVLERLSDRRAELDAFENQLKQREALVAAAEKRMNERADQLKALEVQITALVEQKKALDDEQFKGLVSMYENMKPKAAAQIFDQLSNDVLLRVSSAMNPRKMSPVLAAMNPARAQELTAMMAVEKGEPSLDEAGVQDLTQLPQIIGQ